MKKKLLKNLPYVFCIFGSTIMLMLFVIGGHSTIKNSSDILLWVKGVSLGINIVAITWSLVSK